MLGKSSLSTVRVASLRHMTRTRVLGLPVGMIIIVYDLSPDVHYQSGGKNSPKQYSHQLVEWIAERYKQDNEFFERTRKKAKAS